MFCHGENGSGGSGPNIPVMSPLLSDDELYTILLHGKGVMPGNLLDGTEAIVDVMVLIRSWEN